MNNLTLFEKGLVPVYKTDAGEYIVNGRELWEGLQSRQDFSTWVKKRLSECDAFENEDFDRLHKKMEANNATTIEYIIQLDTAKEMAMLERNEIGKQVRKYFIAVEKKSKKPVAQLLSGLSPLLQVCINLETAQRQQQSAIENMDKRLNGIEEKLTPKKQVKAVPTQTELTFQEEFYKNTMRKDRISTERIAAMYLQSSMSFYKKLCFLGFVIPGEWKGWTLSQEYENKGIGFNQPRCGGYETVAWSKQGYELIKQTLKDNGIYATKKLAGRKKRK